jgi:hypothetical protein
MVTAALFSGLKRPKREADYSSPPGVEVKKTLIYTYTPPYVFVALYLVKHKDNFTSYLTFYFFGN